MNNINKHYCGGLIVWRREESFFYCQNCNRKFDSIETLERENLIAEQSDEQYEVEQ